MTTDHEAKARSIIEPLIDYIAMEPMVLEIDDLASAIATALREAEERATARIDELTEKWQSSRNACASACRSANELRSKVEGLEAAINADEIVLILSENEGASHGYLAVQICEKIEADAHEKHLSSEYMRSRPAKETTDV